MTEKIRNARQALIDAEREYEEVKSTLSRRAVTEILSDANSRFKAQRRFSGMRFYNKDCGAPDLAGILTKDEIDAFVLTIAIDAAKTAAIIHQGLNL